MDFKNAGTLNLGAKNTDFSNAKVLRKTMTDAEKLLWNALRNRRLNGFKFRKQHPIKRFIADFYCHEARLVIEVDGDIHNDISKKEYDSGRTFELAEYNIRVIRFDNWEVLNEINMVLNKINAEIQISIDSHE
jgi:very-short-patch-repair endonuclease